MFRFHINERDGTITFEEFLSYFPDNEVWTKLLLHFFTDDDDDLESETWISRSATGSSSSLVAHPQSKRHICSTISSKTIPT